MIESKWSRFIADSDISRLNSAGGRRVSVDPSTATLVSSMLEGWRITDHAFDPSTLPVLHEAGYRCSIDDPYKVTLLPDGAVFVSGYDSSHGAGSDTASRSGLSRQWATMSDIVVDVAGSTVTLPPGLVLDPGGIGKGLAADMAVRHLIACGAAGALVGIGGDIAIAGTPPSDDGWTISVEDPNDDRSDICTLVVDAGGIATSSTRSRRWVHDGRERHHLIDPRLAEQSSTDLAAVTVIAGCGWLAEVHATAALLAGAHDVVGYLERHQLSGIAIGLDGHITASAGLLAEPLTGAHR
jgi:thiamine biosynthesis lipoprotein